jgi:predicted acylesterase/phospholipase RssA
MVSGASAGALNAAGVALGMPLATLESAWTNLVRRDVLAPEQTWLAIARALGVGLIESALHRSCKKGFDRVPSLFDTESLAGTIERILGPFSARFAAGPRLVIAVTDLSHRLPQYWYCLQGDFAEPSSLYRRIHSFGRLAQLLAASASIPLAFPPSNGLFDGGVFRNQPLGPCLVDGLGEGPVFVLIPSGGRATPATGLSSTVTALLEAWLEAGLAAAEVTTRVRQDAGQNAQPVCYIFASREVPERFGMLDFGLDPRRLIDIGYADAIARLDRFNESDRATWFAA